MPEAQKNSKRKRDMHSDSFESDDKKSSSDGYNPISEGIERSNKKPRIAEIEVAAESGMLTLDVQHHSLSRKSFLLGPFLADLRNNYRYHQRLVREETELRQARNDLVAVFRDLPQSHILNVDEETVKLIQLADTHLPELRDDISSSKVKWSF